MIVRNTRVVSIVGVVLALVWSGDVASAQAKPAASFVGLTPTDYIEIRQLVARYAYAVDTGADNGNVYASLFAPDGAFADRMGRETKGWDALAALARRNTRGPQSAFHFIVNHVIEPISDGAVGKGVPPSASDWGRPEAERNLRRRALPRCLREDTRRLEVQASSVHPVGRGTSAEREGRSADHDQPCSALTWRYARSSRQLRSA